jgi:hypothetical protein
MKRNVLPGIITVQDMMITTFSQETQHIRMSSLLDDEFVVDKFEREKYSHEIIDEFASPKSSHERDTEIAKFAIKTL